MRESAMRQLFVKCLRDARLDPVSVENLVGPGTPDVNCILGWIELKQLDGWPVRGSTPVRINHLTAQQKTWLYRRWLLQKTGAWLLIKIGKEWLLIDGNMAPDVGRLPQTALRQVCSKITGNPAEIVSFLVSLQKGSR